MQRRTFIALAGAAATWPIGVVAQQAGKIPNIGVLWHAANEQEEAIYLNALRQGFADLGYVEGRNVRLHHRFPAEQYERFNAFAAELVAQNVDVLVVVTRPAALAAQRATKTIPVVFILVPDPVLSKLVESLSHPGGNITGLSQVAFDLFPKRLQILHETVSHLAHVAVLVNPADPDDADRFVEQARIAATALKVKAVRIEAKAPEDLERAFSMVPQEAPSAVLVMNDAMFFNERKRIADLGIARRLPVMGFSRAMAQDGVVITYGADVSAIFRRAPSYVDRILKGAKPADLPVELPTRFQLIINLKTAKAIGLTVAPTLLASAVEVIE